jgi:L-ascorbate metabolism protein UlaG (beta-lactamase superfamily)
VRGRLRGGRRRHGYYRPPLPLPLEEGIIMRRPRPVGIFKTLLASLFDFTKPAPAKFLVSISDLTDPDKLTLTYVGHATIFINFYGTAILTDPIFVTRIGGILKRKIEPGLKISELPPLDILLISHAHLDHLNRPSLRQLAPRTKTLIVPKNCSDLVDDLGFENIIELHWGETLRLENLKLLTFRPQHWGTRWPWERIARGYNSYLISKNNRTILFAGDTGYSKIFEEISKQYPIDIVMFPITAYNPPAFRQMHMHPEDAVRAFEESRAKYLIPIQWGVFRLSFEPMAEPPRLIEEIMRQRGLSDKLKLLNSGEYLSLYPSSPGEERVG